MFLSRFVLLVLFLAGFTCSALAQSTKQELEVPEKVSVSVKNLEGRVSVIASAEQDKKVMVEANSAGAPVATEDVKVDLKGGKVSIDVRPRGERGPRRKWRRN